MNMRMENPLSGAFNRERTVLVFQQRSLEARAALWATIGGFVMALLGVLETGPMSWWLIFFGLAFALAGCWAYLLFRMIRFDLRARTYVERFRSGWSIQWRRGSIDEVNCIGVETYRGLLPEVRLGAGGWHIGGLAQSAAGYAGQVHVLRLWWKDRNHYPTVIEHLYANRPSGLGPEKAPATFIALAQTYARALRVPLFDQSPP